MYTYVSASTLSRSPGSQWSSIDISEQIVSAIYATNSKVFLTLHDSTNNVDVYVDFLILKTEFSTYSDTLNNLLVHLGTRVLPTIIEIPNANVKRVRYSDAFRSNYKVNLCKIGIQVPANYPADSLPDLAITRPKYDTPIELLHTHTLLSVNGLFHMSESGVDQTYIVDGAETMRKSRENHVGITSFLDIGALTKVKIDSARILGQTPTSPLKDKVVFSIDENLDGKSYMMVLGGYLVFPKEDLLWRNGQNTLSLNLNYLPYLERLYESSLYIDTSSLGLSTPIQAPDSISITEAWSDEVIRKYFTMSQSYLVIIDKPNLVTNKIHLRHSNMPGMFTAYQNPIMPLFAGHGKIAEYWKTYEDNQWSVTVQDSFIRNYILSQQPNGNSALVNDHLLTTDPFKHSRGYLLEISAY